MASEPGSLRDRVGSAVTALEELRDAYRIQNRWRNAVVAIALVVAMAAMVLAYQQGTATCQATNVFRRADKARWDYILDLTKNQPRTPEAEEQRQNFKTYIARADKLRDCSLL